MITINGLLPDLKKEELEKKSKNQPVAKFNYDNSLEETDLAMKMFQKRFSSKRGIMFTIAYLLIMAGGIVAIIFNPTNVILYIAVAVCLLGLVYHLTAKTRIRKSIIKTLGKMNPEEYCCTIYNKKIEIETIIKPKDIETEKNVENSEGEGEKSEDDVELNEPTPIKSVFKIGDDLLNFAEDNVSLYLIFNRQQIYCFPKRCLSEEVQNTVRDFLTEKLENND